MRKELEFLKRRAGKFYEYGKTSFAKGDYEISAFNIEQAIQLYLKYTIGILLGDFPRIHSISRLLVAVSKASGKKEFEELLNSEPNLIANIEEVYLTSRYLPSEFSRSQVENIIKFADKLINMLGSLWN